MKKKIVSCAICGKKVYYTPDNILDGEILCDECFELELELAEQEAEEELDEEEELDP